MVPIETIIRTIIPNNNIHLEKKKTARLKEDQRCETGMLAFPLNELYCKYIFFFFCSGSFFFRDAVEDLALTFDLSECVGKDCVRRHTVSVACGFFHCFLSFFLGAVLLSSTAILQPTGNCFRTISRR